MKYIIANWKMNMDILQIKKWFFDFEILIKGKNFNNKIIIAPPLIYLNEVSDLCKSNNLFCSSQDVSLYDKGAHTGEVGAFEIKDYCTYSIIGHSERKESREVVLKKSEMCIKYNITPIVCFINKSDFVSEASKEKIMSWEDPSNISKNGVYQQTNLENIIKTMKGLKEDKKDQLTLYGGSVNRENMQDLANISEIDGVLVGNASLDPQHFFEIIETFGKEHK